MTFTDSELSILSNPILSNKGSGLRRGDSVVLLISISFVSTLKVVERTVVSSAGEIRFRIVGNVAVVVGFEVVVVVVIVVLGVVGVVVVDVVVLAVVVRGVVDCVVVDVVVD